jgi:hypothetical protein
MQDSCRGMATTISEVMSRVKNVSRLAFQPIKDRSNLAAHADCSCYSGSEMSIGSIHQRDHGAHHTAERISGLEYSPQGLV